MYPKAPIRAPAPVKAPTPLLAPVVPARSPASGYYYYAPIPEALPCRISRRRSSCVSVTPKMWSACSTTCVPPMATRRRVAPPPPMRTLACDPEKDPSCRPQLVQKAPSGVFHRYPTCDTTTDPYCLLRMRQAAQNQEAAPPPSSLKRPCNPLVDSDCNPLTATRFVDLSRYAQTQEKEREQDPQDEPAPARGLGLRSPL